MSYAVRNGRQTGVYNSWEECKEQVHRYPSASYKKFSCPQDAQSFVESRNPHSSSHYSEGGSGEVYVDGACSRNGQYGASAGIGVYWGKDDPRNVSERFTGRQTNQSAELQAARRGVEQAREQNMERLVVHTDSTFTTKAPFITRSCKGSSDPLQNTRQDQCLEGMTEWVPRWKENGWKTIDGRDVVNRQDFERLDQACKGMQVKWNYVPAHAGVVGNEMADQLARQGATK